MRRFIKYATIAALMSGSSLTNASDLSDAIADDYSYLGQLFDYFHRNPELSMQEFKTSDRLARELEVAGFEVIRDIAETGLVGIMRNGDGPTLMIRADMDGLPVKERSGLAYASTVTQVNLNGVERPVMHACGHDMHMTSFIGTARRMAALKEQWQGTLVMLGQPAEEAIGGADAMVKDGLYDRIPRPDFALALHASSAHEAGKIVVSNGLMFSSADTVEIVVHGVGTHGASPQLGKDPIVIASTIVMALQTIITREIGPLDAGIVTVGAFHSGTAPNVISEEAVLDLTVRSNDDNVRATLLAAIKRIAENAGRMAGMAEDMLPTVTVEDSGVPPTINDRDLAIRVRKAMAAGMDEDMFEPFVQTLMWAEDFPLLVRVSPPIPSVYFYVGGTPRAAFEAAAAGGPAVAGHHSPLFKIAPEPSVKAGVEAMTLAALDLLAKP